VAALLDKRSRDDIAARAAWIRRWRQRGTGL